MNLLKILLTGLIVLIVEGSAILPQQIECDECEEVSFTEETIPIGGWNEYSVEIKKKTCGNKEIISLNSISLSTNIYDSLDVTVTNNLDEFIIYDVLYYLIGNIAQNKSNGYQIRIIFPKCWSMLLSGGTSEAEYNYTTCNSSCCYLDIEVSGSCTIPSWFVDNGSGTYGYECPIACVTICINPEDFKTFLFNKYKIWY